MLIGDFWVAHLKTTQIEHSWSAHQGYSGCVMLTSCLAAVDPKRLPPEFSMCIASTTITARSGPEQVQHCRSWRRQK
jgi:hypothetical protein